MFLYLNSLILYGRIQCKMSSSFINHSGVDRNKLTVVTRIPMSALGKAFHTYGNIHCSRGVNKFFLVKMKIGRMRMRKKKMTRG